MAEEQRDTALRSLLPYETHRYKLNLTVIHFGIFFMMRIYV